ncbi:erythromycin esterase family protein [Albibacterium indicum]|uniref:erythromycin esterase family protein n=1 Tax=Albibacterium indicum TaxID=2292082 RepID=UPI000E5330FB|nr:erythromycin esterase family protein [Pedobacter indicus]
MKFLKIVAGIILAVGIAIGAFFLWHKVQMVSAKSDIQDAFMKYDLDNSSTSSHKDLSFLNPLLEDKDIIAFGEATHGTKEFHIAFTQLAKHLIVEGKVNTLVFAERNFADSWKVNEFVLSLGDSISVERVFPYSSKEEKELINWIRAFNKGKDYHEQVWVAGADMYHPKFAAINALHLLGDGYDDLSIETQHSLNSWANSPVTLDFFISENESETTRQEFQATYELFSERVKAEYWRTRWFTQSIKMLNKVTRHIRTDLQDGVRDSVIFDHIVWLRNIRENSKLLIFAHNAHIEKYPNNTLSENDARLGWLIQEKFPENYFTIGSEVKEGNYRAGHVQSYHIPQSFMKIGSIVANAVDADAGYINLHHSDEVRDFFNKDWYMTYGVLDTGRPTYPVSKEFSNAFDVLFWVKNSTPLSVSPTDVYNIVAPFSKEKNPEMFSDSVVVQVKTDFSLFPVDSRMYDYPDLILLSFSHKKLVGHSTKKIKATGSHSLTHQNMRAEVDSLVVYLGGDKSQSFTLGELSVNNHPIDKKHILYGGPNYESVEKTNTLLHLVIKD